MFNKILSGMTLTSNIANSAFGNIQYVEYNGDETFTATLRALLVPRVGKDKLETERTSVTYDSSVWRNHGLREIMNATFNDGRLKAGLHICGVEASNENDRRVAFESLDDTGKGFVATYPGYTAFEPIRKFMAQYNINVRVYINEGDRSAVIFVERMNARKWHMIQGFIPKILPWYFANNPLNADEIALVRSLVEQKASDEYERLIEEFASKFDMRSYAIDSIIGGIERKAREAQLSQTDSEIRDTLSEMEHLMDRYSDYVRQLDDLNIRRVGIAEALNNASDDSELVRYFKANKSLEPIGSSRMVFEFIVKTTLDSWNPDFFERVVDKDDGCLYRDYTVGNREFRSVDARRKFFKAIFSDDPLLRIRMCGYYKIDLRGHVTSCSNYHYPSSCDTYIPNPHLHNFNCLGNHERQITSCLQSGNTIGAVEQCVASAKSVNLSEPPTMQHFLDYLFRTNANIIELPDRTTVSPVKALEWLNEHEKED